MRFPGYWFSGLSVFLYLVLLWVCVKQLNNNKWRSVRYLLLTVICFSFAGIGYFLFSSQRNASYNSFCRINLTERSAYSDGEYILGLYPCGQMLIKCRAFIQSYSTFFIERDIDAYRPYPVSGYINQNITLFYGLFPDKF